MVKFKGRSSIKQYQPLKPVKRGFKVWCTADSSNGYVGNFVVYTGKLGDGPTNDLGYKVVMELCKDNLGKVTMSIVTIILQVSIWLLIYRNKGSLS